MTETARSPGKLRAPQRTGMQDQRLQRRSGRRRQTLKKRSGLRVRDPQEQPALPPRYCVGRRGANGSTRWRKTRGELPRQSDQGSEHEEIGLGKISCGNAIRRSGWARGRFQLTIIRNSDASNGLCPFMRHGADIFSRRNCWLVSDMGTVGRTWKKSGPLVMEMVLVLQFVCKFPVVCTV